MAENTVDLTEQMPMWKLARHGINLLINNKSEEAETLFKRYPDNLQMFAGYAFVVFIDALMTFEDDKLVIALQNLRETERRCTAENGWFKSVRSRVFGMDSKSISKAEELETQIILADSQLCIALLTILQQDISGFLKGGWILRRSWKIYQQVYTEISGLYKAIVGDTNIPNPAQVTCSSDEVSLAESENPTPEESTSNFARPNGYIPHSHTVTFHPHPSENNCNSLSTISSLRKSLSVHSALSRSRSKFFSSNILSPFNSNLNLNFLGPSFGLFLVDKKRTDDMDKETVIRLMSAVSFGYGLFQLGVSLLPPSLLKLSSIFGFGGNRSNGLTCLMYARQGSDMRAPLATLSLLWYHTIVRPFYAIDGSNVEAGVEISLCLIEESEKEYKDSAYFLFFRGRVKRLSSQIPQAIEAFRASVENTTQRELKILSLHEIGWCHLIQLEYVQGEAVFQYLTTASRWSRSFYIYLASLCLGASATFKDSSFLCEMKQMFDHAPKNSQLEEYLDRRFKLFPNDAEDLSNTSPVFWKLLVYETLFLWNTLPSCNTENIRRIMADCAWIKNNRRQEPMVGLSELIEGCCHLILGNVEHGIQSLRDCLASRKDIVGNADDSHVSAFAQFELGSLLVKNEESREEGKNLLQQISQYKGYDFEQRLTVRIHGLLKNM